MNLLLIPLMCHVLIGGSYANETNLTASEPEHGTTAVIDVTGTTKHETEVTQTIPISASFVNTQYTEILSTISFSSLYSTSQQPNSSTSPTNEAVSSYTFISDSSVAIAPIISSSHSLTPLSLDSGSFYSMTPSILESDTAVSSQFQPDVSTSQFQPDVSTSQFQPDISTLKSQPTLSTAQSHPTPTSTPSSTSPPTTKAPNHTVKISETNILLVKPKQFDSMFVELSGAPNESLDGVFLTIRDASDKNSETGILQFLKLTGSLNSQSISVISSPQLAIKKVEFTSVVVALYSDESDAKMITNGSLLDSFLFSVDPDNIDSEIAEVYLSGMSNILYVNRSMMNLTPDVSLSLCSENTNSGFVLTIATNNKPNQCGLNVLNSLQMKLTRHVGKKSCTLQRPNQYTMILTKEIVTRVNSHSQCGLSSFNIEAMMTHTHCKDGNKIIAVNFNVKSAFDKQMRCIKIGYESFTTEKSTVPLDGHLFLVSNCSLQCFSNAVPASADSGNNIKVTVAVVISCIGIFLVILLAVIIYMKRKRRGLLQFRMTRLDEDDDDLVGDMDDFVGNQGATFNNFR